MGTRKDRVAYFYDHEIGDAYFGSNHPMKPHRLCMTHHLVIAYGLHKDLQVFRSRKAYPSELTQFHTKSYIQFLERLTPEPNEQMKAMFAKYGIGDDCPPFEGLFDFCAMYAGASIDGARRINSGLCDIAINWAGGLHHAKQREASGFCYVNDLVLAILELLKFHARVLYIDIDVHHGDGVEEAFYMTDRVLTVSFHKYGEMFFPGTGALHDIGEKRGRYYSINVPLCTGADDQTFHRIFQPIMTKVMEVFSPGAIVLQCGADSLADDRLGNFMLSLDGHARAVEFVKKFNIPMLVCGGGGYTKNNVARCWANETAVLVGRQLDDAIPPNAYYEYYGPEHTLSFKPKRPFANANKAPEIERITQTVLENLSQMAHTPGVQMREFPPDEYIQYDDEGEEEDPDALRRLGQYVREHKIIEGFQDPALDYLAY